MNFLIRYFRRSSKAAFTPLSIFLLGAVLSYFISSCTKENMPQWDTTQPTSISQRTPTISISEAKDFVEKMKAIGKQTSSLGETEKILTNLDLDWKKAMNDFSQTGIEFVTAPILFNPVAKLNGDTKVLVYKDSLNQLTACFMTYVPDSDYYKDNKGKMSPLTFTGTIIYTNLQGKPFLSLKIKNGKFQKYLSLTIERGAGNALGSRGVSECISMTMECQFVLQGCTSTVNFCDCTCDCGWTWQTNTAGSTGVPGVSGGCGEYDTGGLGAGSGSGGGGVGGGSGGGTASSWGSSQPTNVITDINRYVFLLQEEGFDLSKLPKLDEVAAEIYYNSWTKYRDVGFNPAEFTTLSADANLFAQVDGFLNKHANDESAKQHTKDMALAALQDSELREAIVSWNPFLVDVCKDLAFDLLWKLFEKHAPGLKDKALIEDLVKDLRSEDYLALTHDILNIAKRYVPWAKFVDITWDGYEFGKKFEKAYTAFSKIQKLGDGLGEKLLEIIKRRGGGVLDKIEWIGGNTGGKIKDITVLDVWDDLVTHFGATTRAGNTNEIIFEKSINGKNVQFKLYINSNTPRGEATISFTINGFAVKFGFDK